tara:strand:- start:24906 stop:25478 length:573 start_codon:yes stop_codon:yes gene_type:complete
MILHNFDWQGLTLPDETAPATQFPSDIKDLNVSAPILEPIVPDVKIEPTKEVKEVEEVKKEIAIVVQEPGTPVEVETPAYNSETQRFLNENKILMWCSPPVITEHIDHLYGENQRTIEYTTKFSFEGVIVSQEDLEMRFWSPVKLTRHSIIFPREVKSRRSRWWRIVEIEEKDGTFAKCIPSDHSPNFSE